MNFLQRTLLIGAIFMAPSLFGETLSALEKINGVATNISKANPAINPAVKIVRAVDKGSTAIGGVVKESGKTFAKGADIIDYANTWHKEGAFTGTLINAKEFAKAAVADAFAKTVQVGTSAILVGALPIPVAVAAGATIGYFAGQGLSGALDAVDGIITNFLKEWFAEIARDLQAFKDAGNIEKQVDALLQEALGELDSQGSALNVRATQTAQGVLQVLNEQRAKTQEIFAQADALRQNALADAIRQSLASATIVTSATGSQTVNGVQEITAQNGDFPEGNYYVVQAHIPNTSGSGANNSYRWARIYGLNSRQTAQSLVDQGRAVSVAEGKSLNVMKAYSIKGGDRVKVGIQWLPQNTLPTSNNF